MVIIKLNKYWSFVYMEEKTKQQKAFDKQFGNFVRLQRQKKGWSQPELASKVGNNFQNISRLERGMTTPTLFWCYKLAEAFDIELSVMLKKFGYKL
jgi:ribosome-binding protein aMBF1 (putative translation factor)